MSIGAMFLDFSERKLRQQTERIGVCLALLDDGQIWRRANAESNPIGNLVLHLAGNVRQWIVSGVGGAADVRFREGEFAASADVDLLVTLRAAVDVACSVLVSVSDSRLNERVTIQGYSVTVLEAIYHVVEHFSGHTGQIIQGTKMLVGRPLDFYAHLGGTHVERTP